MPKLQRNYGRLRSPTGGEVVIRNRQVAHALEQSQRVAGELQESLRAARERATMAEQAAQQINTELTRVRTHWWVKLGYRLRVLR